MIGCIDLPFSPCSFYIFLMNSHCTCSRTRLNIPLLYYLAISVEFIQFTHLICHGVSKSDTVDVVFSKHESFPEGAFL